MWVWILIIIIGFFAFFTITRYIGSKMYGSGYDYDERSSFIRGLKKIKDACCGVKG